MGLTRDDVKRLRSADRVLFTVKEGEGWITLIRQTGNEWDEEIRQTIGVDVSVKSYEEGYRGSYIEIIEAFEMLHTPRLDDEWSTVVDLVRMGDRLSFHYVVNNVSDSMREIGWTRDELSIMIHRPSKRGEKRYTFRIASVVVPRHSTARMVRGVRKSLTSLCRSV